MPLRLPDCFRTRWIALGAIPLTFACQEASTVPDRDGFAPPGAPTRDASPGTVQGPVHIPIAETNTVGWGTLPWTGTGMTVPPYTSYIVKVSGRTTVSPNPGVLQCRPDYPPPYGSEGSYGPSGDRYYQLRVEPGLITSAGVGSVGLRYDGTGTSGGDNAQSDTVFTWDGGEIAMRRSGIQGSTNSSTGCRLAVQPVVRADDLARHARRPGVERHAVVGCGAEGDRGLLSRHEPRRARGRGALALRGGSRSDQRDDRVRAERTEPVRCDRPEQRNPPRGVVHAGSDAGGECTGESVQ